MDHITALHQSTFDGLPTTKLYAPAPSGKLRQLIIEAINPPSTPLEDMVSKGEDVPSNLYPILLVEFEYAFAERIPCELLQRHLASVEDVLDMKYYTYYANELGLRHIARKLMHHYRQHRRSEGLQTDGNILCFYDAHVGDTFTLLSIGKYPRSGALAVA